MKRSQDVFELPSEEAGIWEQSFTTAPMDISIEEMRSNPFENSNFELLWMSHSLKVPYMSRILSRFSLRGGRGRLFEGGCLFQILSHRRGTNLKQGAYLKLGANSSIYGKWLILTMISRKEWRELYFIMFSQQWR